MRNEIGKSFEQIHATDDMKQAAHTSVLRELEKRGNRRRLRIRPLSSACAALLLCFLLGGWYVWETPVSYVSIDVNPSVELILNRFNYVTGTEGKNEAGAALLQGIHLKRKDYLKAVELLVESDRMQAYLTDDAALTFTVASPNADELLKDLESSTVSLQHNGTCRKANLETAHEAHQCGVSLGKYQAYLNLSEYDESITVEDCQDMTMRQLHDQISQYEESHTHPPGCSHPDRSQKHHKKRGDAPERD